MLTVITHIPHVIDGMWRTYWFCLLSEWQPHNWFFNNWAQKYVQPGYSNNVIFRVAHSDQKSLVIKPLYFLYLAWQDLFDKPVMQWRKNASGIYAFYLGFCITVRFWENNPLYFWIIIKPTRYKSGMQHGRLKQPWMSFPKSHLSSLAFWK